jgi:hypothetical protein
MWVSVRIEFAGLGLEIISGYTERGDESLGYTEGENFLD